MPFSKALNILSNLRGKSSYKATAVTEIANDPEEKPEPESQPNPENSDLEHPETTKEEEPESDQKKVEPEINEIKETDEIRSDGTPEEADFSAASTSRIIQGHQVHSTLDSEDQLPDVNDTSDDEDIDNEVQELTQQQDPKDEVVPEQKEIKEDEGPQAQETKSEVPSTNLRRKSLLKALPKIPKMPHFKKPKLHLRKKEIQPHQVEPIELLRDYNAIIKQQTTEEELIYVERKDKFHEMKKGMFSMQQMMEKTRIQENQENRDVVPARYRDLAAAYAVQRSYHNVSMIMQGFLSGLTAAEAIFAFNFANEDLLMHGYRYMSLPAHAVFLACFTVGFVSGLDRLSPQRFTLEGFRKIFSDAGLIGVILWSIGLIATTVCISFDEELSPIIKSPNVTYRMVLMWRICSAIRAFAAAAAWLLIALRAHTDDVCLELKSLVVKDLISVEGITEENLAIIKEKLFQAMNIAQ
ncbi:hypothetical protein WR25_26424 [Diploscapter pachys]|uniref:Uncharacterized protein n=1 Tax=Diploscapter pachys TaxID=2018661 RepID=A0A2A2JLN9_9BILA|nr:hypothetical protein WR25_26424 [Diploscapter pachys]